MNVIIYILMILLNLINYAFLANLYYENFNQFDKLSSNSIFVSNFLIALFNFNFLLNIFL